MPLAAMTLYILADSRRDINNPGCWGTELASRGRAERYNTTMYHYNPSTALEELTEDATLPNPVHVRDMMLRHKLTVDQSLELNRIFLEYQKFFGEAQKVGKQLLQRLSS
jgi:hypothetical protein